MRLFHPRIAFFILLFCLPLLFLPKINLIRIDQETMTGIRVDDFFLFAFALLLAWAHFSIRKGLLPIESWIVAITCFSLFSWVINRGLVTMQVLYAPASLFHCVRLIEYFLFFYIGLLAARAFRERTVVALFFSWNFLLMILQRLGIVGEFSSIHGYLAESTYRVSGIASFPSEMGALLSMLFCYFLWAPLPLGEIQSRVSFFKEKNSFWKSIRPYLLFLLFLVLIVITGSRIAVAALFFSFIYFLIGQTKRRSILSIVALAGTLSIALIAAVLLALQTDSIAVRSQGLLSWKNIELVQNVWEYTNISTSPDALSRVEYGEYDMSWWIRIHKWCYALKAYLLNPECYLQGLGPGAMGMALDGGWLRIVVENGWIGAFFYWKLFSTIVQQSQALKWIVIAFLINMIFFDIYLAYKPMSLLLLLSGYEYSSKLLNPRIRDAVVA